MTAKPPAGSAGPVPADFAEAHRALLADGSIQFDLPLYQPPTPGPPPAWLTWLTSFFSADHPWLRLTLYGVAALIAALLVFLIVRAILRSGWWRRFRRRDGDVDDPAEQARVAGARALLSEADALAARGAFAEAVHLLLFRSLEHVEARRPGLLRPALTSRDIAGHAALPPRPRTAFARIAAAVERSLFARRALDEGDWRTCRTAYEEFAFAEGWRG